MNSPPKTPDPEALFFQGGPAPFVGGSESLLLIPSLRCKSGASYLVGGGLLRPSLAERGAPLPL